MIGVGINKNVMLSRVAIGEKGALELYFDEAVQKASVFDSMQSAKVENTGTETRLLVFPFKPPSGVRNEGKTEDELIEMTSEDMLKVKNQLTQLLQQYLADDDIKWDPWAGTGADNSNYRSMFQSEETLAKVFENIATQFITMLGDKAGKPAYKLRVKLVRQSKDKHFATIPGKFLADNPWVELMDIPEEASKVKFTKWEIDNKFDDGTPVEKPAASDEIAPPEGQKSVFGSR